MPRNSGFTLIELLVVIVIVSILAAVSMPIVKANSRRAVLTEAVAALGLIRTAQRMYYVEHGVYQSVGQFVGTQIPDGIKPRSSPGAYDGDLDGTYFSQYCYNVSTSGGGSGFQAWCSLGVSDNDAPQSPVSKKMFPWPAGIAMDEGGNIYTYLIPNSGFQEIEI